MAINTKEAKFYNEIQTVKKISDKLGRGVDRKIIETVAIMRVVGFETVGSCAGHLSRGTTGPYILIESLEAKKYAVQAREHNQTDPRYKRLRQRALYYNALEMSKLLTLLEGFYANRAINLHHCLIVQSLPMTLNTLKCQNAETVLLLNKDAKRILLQDNQTEMYEFTQYVKDRYLRSM